MSRTLIWNVRLQVIDLVAAETPGEALAKMKARLEDDGYSVYYGEYGDHGDAFESGELAADVHTEAIERYSMYRP